MIRREFNDKDRIKKRARIGSTGAFTVPVDRETLTGLENAVKAKLDNGYLPCARAFGIAKEFKVALTMVGDTADGLGLRISNCQLDCFKVDKTINHDLDKKTINQKALEALDVSLAEGPLSCLGAFQLAKQIGLRPMDVADAANSRHVKIHNCQLGCW